MLRSNSSVKKTKKHGVIYLSKQGPEVTSASADELEIRRISGIFSFSDPDGNRFLIELG